jgi:hypothetical protein
LGVLRKAGLVATRKDAKLVFYRLAPAELGALSAVLAALAPTPAPAPAPAAAAQPLRPAPVAAPSPAPGVANFARLS